MSTLKKDGHRLVAEVFLLLALGRIARPEAGLWLAVGSAAVWAAISLLVLYKWRSFHAIVPLAATGGSVALAALGPSGLEGVLLAAAVVRSCVWLWRHTSLLQGKKESADAEGK